MRTRLAGLAAMAVLSATIGGCTRTASQATTRTTEIPGTQFPLLEVSTTSSSSIPDGEAGRVIDPYAFRYVVKSGDTIVGIASRHGVTTKELVEVNSWDEGLKHRLNPFDVIMIPGNGTLDTSTAATNADGTLAVDADGNCVQRYTVKATDTSRTKVAKRFKIDVDELDAANTETRGYGAFYKGLEIIVPTCEVKA